MALTTLGLCALIALPALAQFQSVVDVKTANATSLWTPGDPRFELHADLPSPSPGVVANYINVTKSSGPPASLGHRYFYNQSAHVYFGYDIVIQPEPPIDTYRVAFYDLSIGLLDLPIVSEDSIDPRLWRKVPLPALPSTKTVLAGENFSIAVFVNPETGGKLIDVVNIAPMPDSTAHYLSSGPQAWKLTHSQPPRNLPAVPARDASTIFGSAREFSLEDVEMRVQTARVTVNGIAYQRFDVAHVASGSLVWVYVPNHGRYILSLAPRPALDFVQAGEVRGGLITFTVGKDDVLVESRAAIAPGDAPYILYVLHDPAWEPTSRAQVTVIQSGSVSPRELTALTRQ